MKKVTNNRPQYYPDTQVVCACGNSFTVGSTKSEIKVDICSACHPFFTGQMKYVDAGGRVSRFEKRMSRAQKSASKPKKKNKKGQSSITSAKTLKEMLEQVK